ncbi:LysR substrate-binding domain-containing protein [Shinella sp. BYT-45]|uniref:LysR substrate-binding domain-containing protein n=1 Tax=Shinella sp. BYT-45 TaxID=3377377 RepID=UPI00397F5AAA
MVSARNFDMDVLRTFVTGVRLGSFAKAAEALGRTPPAVSLQLRKLSDLSGQTLFTRQGRGLALTDAGEALYDYAVRILDLNDEAMMMLGSSRSLDGWLRLGIPQDFAETSLPPVLGRFSRAHPKLRVEARVDRGAKLVAAVERGDLDMAVTWGGPRSLHCQHVATHPIVWIAAADYALPAKEAVPLIAFDPPCSFRTAAVDALSAARREWRQVFASPGLAGLWAAVTAGLGVTIRTTAGMPPHLRVLDPERAGLPVLGSVDLMLHTAEAMPSAPVLRLRDILLDMLASPS